MIFRLKDKWNKGRLFRVALFLLLLVVTSWHYTQPKIIAVVGETSLYMSDISYRIAIAQAYDEVMKPAAALVALIKDTQEQTVASQYGVLVSTQELTNFSKGVDKHSKAPAILHAIKQAFSENEEAYKRLYLRPKLINRKLHHWFSRDIKLQAKPRAIIQQAYQFVMAGNDFEQVSAYTNLKYIIQNYKAEQKETPNALQTYFPDGMSVMTPPFQSLLDKLEVGDIAQTISEDNRSYRVVRLLAKKDGQYKTEEIIAEKESFDLWYQAQVKTIPIKILSETLYTPIIQDYPNLRWVSSVKIK